MWNTFTIITRFAGNLHSIVFLIAFVSQKYQQSTHLTPHAAFELGDGNTKKVQKALG